MLYVDLSVDIFLFFFFCLIIANHTPYRLQVSSLCIIYLNVCYITADMFNDSWALRGLLFKIFPSLLTLLAFFVSSKTLSIIPNFTEILKSFT